MKNIEFKHVSIKDFQGIEHFEFDFKEGTTRIFGTNATGKSSVIDAILWVITGKNQKDQVDSSFEIVPLDKESRMIPEAEPHVELTIDVDGKNYVIERTLKLKVPKTKGGDVDYTSRFKTERTFFINGLNYKATQFNNELKDIFGDDETFKTLTNVVHFGNNKSEKAQRDLLLSYIKPVSHEMICELDERFKTLNELEKLEFGNVLEQTRARINETKKEIEAIKNRADEVSLALAEFKDVDVSKFGELEVERSNIQNELSRLKKQLEEQSKKQEEKNQLNRDLLSIEHDIKNFNEDFYKQQEMDIEALNRKIRNTKEDIENRKNKRTTLVNEFEGLNTKIENAEIEVNEIIERKIEELKEDNVKKINRETKYYDESINRFKEKIVEKKNETVEETCNACGQDLPLENVEQVKTYIQNAISGFEAEIEKLEKQKDDALASINKEHKASVEELKASKTRMVTSRTDGYRKEQDSIQSRGMKNNEEKGLLESKLLNLEKDLEELKAKTPDQKKKDVLFDKKEKIEKSIQELSGDDSISYKDVDEKQMELDVLNNKLNSKDQITKNKNRKKELKDSQKAKIKGLSDLEAKKSLLEEYIQKKNDLLSKELRNHFNKSITFKFIEFTQDGTPKDVFKLLINGVPYNNANTAGRIIAGVQMIDFFQEKLGVKLPILIDNKEAVVVDLPNVDTQILECVAHKDYKKLTVEGEK